jgi:hypothetical protein
MSHHSDLAGGLGPRDSHHTIALTVGGTLNVAVTVAVAGPAPADPADPPQQSTPPAWVAPVVERATAAVNDALSGPLNALKDSAMITQQQADALNAGLDKLRTDLTGKFDAIGSMLGDLRTQLDALNQQSNVDLQPALDLVTQIDDQINAFDPNSAVPAVPPATPDQGTPADQGAPADQGTPPDPNAGG